MEPTIDAALRASRNHEVPSTSVRKEVFALDEGDVVLTFPENLSADSYADLEAYFQLFLRKAKRRSEAERREEREASCIPADN